MIDALLYFVSNIFLPKLTIFKVRQLIKCDAYISDGQRQGKLPNNIRHAVTSSNVSDYVSRKRILITDTHLLTLQSALQTPTSPRVPGAGDPSRDICGCGQLDSVPQVRAGLTDFNSQERQIFLFLLVFIK
jgi:hypothetical protein